MNVSSRLRRLPPVLAGLLLVGSLLVGMAGPADSAAGGAGVAALAIDGRGLGHGVGLAQDGALSMGRAGAGTLQILGQFYPGTSLARAGGTVRVQVLSAAAGSTTVVFPSGGQVQDAPSGPQSAGFPLRVPAGTPVELRWAGGRYSARVLGQVSAQSLSTAVTLPPVPGTPGTTTTTTAPTTGSTTTTTAPSGPGLPGLPGSPGTTTPGSGPGGGGSPGGPGGPAPGTASSTRPLWAVPDSASVTAVPSSGRRYRGVVEATASGTALDLVDQLDVESYLRGMGEVRNPSWPLTSLQAQVIVERTYALRAMAADGEICDDTRCQVYLGQQAEYPAQDRAVATTTGYVLVYGGHLAATVFSANAGGVSATPEEGFGSPDASYPYLRAARYYTTDPHPWSLTVALADVAGRLGYPGTVSSVAVTATGPSGRALTVTLDGSAGRAQISGISFAASLGLDSNLFRLRDVVSATAPPPPPPAQAEQALPTDAGALAQSVGSGGTAASPTSRRHLLTRTGPPGGGPLRWAGLAVLLVVGAGTAATWRRRRSPAG